MKEICRICARELCGNQRRWIFHTASKLNLQVLLSHVLGKDVSRDGKAEFACSKCAFMLDRIYRDNADKTLDTNEVFLEKLRQRIQDRAVALERVIDEKFSALEEKDKELRQLRLAVRDRDHDLERLRCVLSANEATMQSMESLLRARGLEVEQLTATCQNLQWLKEELETKFGHWQKEQESIIQQLQTSLHDRNKEVEDLSATLLCKLGPGQSEVAEELCQRLQRKERMLQDLLSDRNKQAVEHEMEIQGLLQSMGTREQERQAAAACQVGLLLVVVLYAA